MPVYATRKLRNLAAAAMLVSGVSHVAQLWLQPLSATVVYGAFLGGAYLLTGLGLSGHSRLSLWLAVMLPAGELASSAVALIDMPAETLVWHGLLAAVVLAASLTILVKTRNVVMD